MFFLVQLVTGLWRVARADLSHHLKFLPLDAPMYHSLPAKPGENDYGAVAGGVHEGVPSIPTPESNNPLFFLVFLCCEGFVGMTEGGCWQLLSGRSSFCPASCSSTCSILSMELIPPCFGVNESERIGSY